MSSKMKVIVKDEDGNIIPDEKLKETVIMNEMYYMYIHSYRKRIREMLALVKEKNSTD